MTPSPTSTSVSSGAWKQPDPVSALAVEVNDAGLVALRAGASHPLPASPGIVLLGDKRSVIWSAP